MLSLRLFALSILTTATERKATMQNNSKNESIFDSKEGCLAVAIYNLCIRNNIDIKDFIKTIKETRIEIKKEINKIKKESGND